MRFVLGLLVVYIIVVVVVADWYWNKERRSR